jgi:hypothetical protein
VSHGKQGMRSCEASLLSFQQNHASTVGAILLASILSLFVVLIFCPSPYTCALLCHCACSFLFFSLSFLLPLLVLDFCLHMLRPSLAQCLAICALAHHIAVFESEAARALSTGSLAMRLYHRRLLPALLRTRPASLAFAVVAIASHGQ